MDLTTKLPNNMMYFILTQFDSTMGTNGAKAVLNYSGLSRLIDNYPPNDFNPGEPIQTFFALVSSVMRIYGEKGFRALIRDVGKKVFHEMRKTFPWLFEIEDIVLDGLSPCERFTVTYKSYIDKASKIFNTRTSLEIHPNKIIDTSHDCIWCMGLKSNGPICIFTEDFYIAMAEWVGVSHFKVTETHCRAAGDETCIFVSTFD